MNIKICGMKDPDNIREVLALEPDYMGFIFFEGSKRFVSDLDAAWISGLTGVTKTGVFVNEDTENMRDTVSRFTLQAVQLHGNEEPEQCQAMKTNGVEVIKAFGINEYFDWDTLAGYAPVVDYFLFDTKTEQHGGSGKVFDWSLLSAYPLDTPYFLSGGIHLGNIREASQLADNRLYGVDLNSKFESAPGLKDIDKLRQAFQHIRHE